MGSASGVEQLPKIDFSNVEPGTAGWEAVRAQVMEALGTSGCFEAVYPRVAPEVREAIFGTALKELFALPLETKLANTSNKPFHGYLGQIPYLAYESLTIKDPALPDQVQSFAALMWPAGNPTFCEAVYAFSKDLAELDETIRRMVFESLGVERHWASHMESTWLQLRVSEYGAAAEEHKRLGLVPHRDKNTLAIMCQNGVDGLDIETPDGVWITATPSPDSFIIIAGDALRAWTNGRVYSPLHRVVVGGDATRYSAIMFAIPGDDVVIQAPPELVGGDHPALFRPYDYRSYVDYCYTVEGVKAKCQLDAYAAISPATD